MKGLREPLLWIALASFAASLPIPQVALPVSTALALGTLLLMRTRVARFARRPLLLASFALWSVCALNALCLITWMLHGSAGFAFRAADLGMPLALWALANSLKRISDAAVVERSSLWLSAIQLLFLGWFCVDWFTDGAGFVIGFLACPIFAVLVLRMRSEIGVPSAR
jgi:hypothetical protein